MAKRDMWAEGPELKSLEKVVRKALAAVRAAREELVDEGIIALTPDGRAHNAGRLREGEAEALGSVLDTMDAYPALFAALAPHDHGVDPTKVETGPARAALARRALFVPLMEEIEELVAAVSDDMLVAGELAKDVALPAYGIVKASAAASPAVRTAAAKALNFYATVAKQRTPRKQPKEVKDPTG